MKNIMLYFVIIVTLLVVVALMSNVGQVLGQSEPTVSTCDEDNPVCWATRTPTVPEPTTEPYPVPYPTDVEAYPAPVDTYPAPIVEDDNLYSVDVDEVQEYVPTSIPIVLSISTPTCSHLQLHSICHKRR